MIVNMHIPVISHIYEQYCFRCARCQYM